MEASDLARLLFVDDDFREHLQTKLAVGMSTLLPSPVGRLWHVRSELTKQLLHSFTATPGLSAVEVRGPSLPKADPPPSLKVRLADFEASFRAKHGRAITPADGPSLPKEVLAMYREYAESLRMTPEQTKEAVAKLEARETARAAAKVRAEAAAVERARRRTEWEAGKEGAWAAAKSEARDRRSELVADERVLTGASSWVKAEAPTPPPMTKEAYLQRARDKLGIQSTVEEEVAEAEAMEAADWAKAGGSLADAMAQEEAWLRKEGKAEVERDEGVVETARERSENVAKGSAGEERMLPAQAVGAS